MADSEALATHLVHWQSSFWGIAGGLREANGRGCDAKNLGQVIDSVPGTL